MHKLKAAVAVAALLAYAPASAQDITNSPNSAASGSTSAANSGSTSNASNGGVFAPVTVGPIDASSRTTSTSESGAVSGSNSTSISEGGTATSNAAAQGGTATAQTGASTASSNQNQSADNTGNAQSITFNTTNPDKLKTVPQVYAPAMTTTLTETCMGSTSGGVSVLGFGGTLGTTWNDDQCVRRLNARELAVTIGDRQAALALLCQDKDVAAAYQRLGRSCFDPIPTITVANAVPPGPPADPPLPPAKPPVTMQPIPNPPADDGERGSTNG